MGRYGDELRRMTRAQGGGAPTPDPAEPDRTSGGRRYGPLIAIGIAVLLAGFGWMLVRQLMADSKLQDCVMSGRKNCVPVDSAGR